MTPNLLTIACASRDILLEHLTHDFVKSSELGWSADLKLLFLLKAQGGSQLLGFPPLRRRVKQDEFGEQKGNEHPLDPLSHKLNVCDASLGDVEVESRVDTGEKRQQTAPQNAGCAPHGGCRDPTGCFRVMEQGGVVLYLVDLIVQCFC